VVLLTENAASGSDLDEVDAVTDPLARLLAALVRTVTERWIVRIPLVDPLVGQVVDVAVAAGLVYRAMAGVDSGLRNGAFLDEDDGVVKSQYLTKVRY